MVGTYGSYTYRPKSKTAHMIGFTFVCLEVIRRSGVIHAAPGEGRP